MRDESTPPASDAAVPHFDLAEVRRAVDAIIGDLGQVDSDGYYNGTVHHSDVEHLERCLATAPKVASDPALPNSWVNTLEAEREQAMLLAEVELHLQQCRVFITSREKMHPCGVDLHDELQAKVTAALDAIGREKSRG